MGGWGYPHTCAHAHACMHAHAHAHVVNMIISCKWPPPLGEYLGIPYDVIRACMRVILLIWVSLALGDRAGGWVVSGVISYSPYEFRNVQR